MKKTAALGCTLVVLVSLLRPSRGASCPNACSGHGQCDTSNICTCFAGWMNADCSGRVCPGGRAWQDEPTATDTAHALNTECSNRGVCDRATGLCTCDVGWEGISCQRLSCPLLCNYHGRCMSMSEMATEAGFSYSNWDADMMFGCVCDNGYTGYDCSERTCVKGDDPMSSGQVDETQVLDCKCEDTCSGSFTLTFEDHTTADIAYDANLAALDAAIELAWKTLDDLGAGKVTTTFTGGESVVCTASGVSTTLVFQTRHGAHIPAITVTSSLASTSVNAPVLAIKSKGASGAFGTTPASVTSTKEWWECSGRGLCDPATGTCTCYTGYAGSDGRGGEGIRPDCGYAPSPTPTTCPVGTDSLVCSGQGTCTGASAYQCNCNLGYTGFACELRACMTGRAWTDFATAANTAHAEITWQEDDADTLGRGYRGRGTECSNQGLCDRAAGACTCLAGFEGDACERMACPLGGGSVPCAGHGQCLPMKRLAALATDSRHSALLGYSYGANAANSEAWDADAIWGCKCDLGWYGGPFAGQVANWINHDCTAMTCPVGDDPYTIDQVDETQTIACTANGGTFTLQYKLHTTASIAFDATAAAVETALEALQSIEDVTVSFSTGTAACSDSTVTMTVTFISEFNDLPEIVANAASLTSSGSASLVVAEATKGTKESEECSNRGVCDRTTGQCTCVDMYTSSDGRGNYGTRNDCGYTYIYDPYQVYGA